MSIGAHAAVFDIPAGDATALEQAFMTAGENDEADLIQLARDAKYIMDFRVGPISDVLVVNGHGATLELVDHSDAGFETALEGSLTLRDLHATGLFRTPGGGLFYNEGSLYLHRVTVTGTNTGFCGHFGGCIGAVIWNRGALTLDATTMFGNGGLITANGVIANEGILELRSSTIATNASVGLNNEGTATVVNSLIAGNKNGDCAGDPVTSLGHNLDSDGSCGFDQPTDLSDTDPRLGDFGDHGGLVPTVALRPASPAIDAGNPATCSLVDGRGFVRASGPDWDCDIGAFERDGSASGIEPALTATWFDVREDGHFFNVQVLDGDRNEVLVHWNTFDAEGNALWLQGLGEIQDHRVDMTLYEYGGMTYPDFDPSERTREPWGTLTLAFPSCWRGVALYEPLDPALPPAESRLIRLAYSAGLTCR